MGMVCKSTEIKVICRSPNIILTLTLNLLQEYGILWNCPCVYYNHTLNKDLLVAHYEIRSTYYQDSKLYLIVHSPRKWKELWYLQWYSSSNHPLSKLHEITHKRYSELSKYDIRKLG